MDGKQKPHEVPCPKCSKPLDGSQAKIELGYELSWNGETQGPKKAYAYIEITCNGCEQKFTDIILLENMNIIDKAWEIMTL